MEELERKVKLLFYEYFQYMLYGKVEYVYGERIQIVLPDASYRLRKSFRHMLILLLEKGPEKLWDLERYSPGVMMIVRLK